MTAPEFYTRERVFVREVGNDPAYVRASRALVRVEPGVTTEHHALVGVVEVYVIVRGTGIMHLDGASDRLVAAGAVVRIAAGQGQSVTNTGAEDMVIECICTPRFQPDCYTPTMG